MTVIRRILALLLLTVAVIVGASLPASAAFTSWKTLPVTTLSTATVAPPANVSAAGSWCNNGVLSANFSWDASPSPRVSGYSVRTFLADGTSKVFAETDAATTSVTGIYPSHGQAATVAISVTTRTSYGWATESPQAQVPPC